MRLSGRKSGFLAQFSADNLGSRRAGMIGVWLNRAGSDRSDAAPMIKTLVEFKG